MTEISTLPPVPENDNSPSSPWVMLITMLLLISGLILSSAMLLYYAVGGKVDATGNPVHDVARPVEEGGELSSAQADSRQDAFEDPSSASSPFSLSDYLNKRFISGEDDDGTVHWPKLKVTGFGKSTDTEAGFAIINGKHVLVNTYIGEVKLVEIRTHGAVVEYKGEQKVLTVKAGR